MNRITKIILSHPLAVLALLFLVTAGAAWKMRQLEFDISVFSIFDAESPLLKEMLELESNFEIQDPGALIVIAFQHDDLFSPEGVALVEKVTDSLEDIKGLRGVMSLANAPDMSSAEGLISGRKLLSDSSGETMSRLKEEATGNPLYRNYLVSEDGTATAVAAFLPLVDLDKAPDLEERNVIIEKVRETVARLEAQSGVEFHISGPPVIGDEYGRQLKRDLSVFVVLCSLILALILLWIFRNLRGVLLPTITVLGAAGWTIALMVVMGQAINMINSALPVLVMVIGCADSIHILGRYSEDLGRGLSREDALYQTFRHIGVAVLLTSVTSAIGFLSLSTSSATAVQRLGQFASAGIMFAYIFSITLIPSVMVMLDPGPSMPKPGRGPDLFDRILQVFAKLVTEHPGKVLASGLAVMALSAAGIAMLKTDSRMLQELKGSSPFAASTRFIEEKLGGVLDITVVVEAPEGVSALDPAVQKGMWELQKKIEENPGVGSTMSLTSYLVSMNHAFRGEYSVPEEYKKIGEYFFLLDSNEDAFNVYGWISDERDKLRVAVRMHDIQSAELFSLADDVVRYGEEVLPEGSGVKVTGGMLFASRVTGSITEDLVKSLLFAFACIFVVIVILFKSVRLGALSIIPNLLPLMACMGIMGLAGIRLRIATAMVFAIALGIAVDDTIHFLNRYRVERGKGLGVRDSVRNTLSTTGRAITQTSILLVLGMLVLLTGSFKATVHFAVLSATIFSTALYAALLLLPAALVVTADIRKKRMDNPGS